MLQVAFIRLQTLMILTYKSDTFKSCVILACRIRLKHEILVNSVGFLLDHKLPFLFLFNFDLTTLHLYEGWNFNSGNYLFTTDTK